MARGEETVLYKARPSGELSSGRETERAEKENAQRSPLRHFLTKMPPPPEWEALCECEQRLYPHRVILERSEGSRWGTDVDVERTHE